MVLVIHLFSMTDTPEIDDSRPNAKSACAHLWRVIARFDGYYATTNTKGALLGAFAASVLGALLMKGGELSMGHPIAQGLVVMAATGAVLVLGCVLAAIVPFRTTQHGRARSGIYFEDVAVTALKDFEDGVIRSTQRELVSELASQAHALSSGLCKKFRWLSLAAYSALFGVLLPVWVLTFCLVLR